MGRLVEFLICGTQKGGTTALADYLRHHPALHIPKEKEIHFFDDEAQNWVKPNYQVYHQKFIAGKPSQLWGEATPIYMYWDSSPKRIWQYNPKMKIIIILRNPISRAYSHWSMEYNRGNDKLGFAEAIKKEVVRAQASLPLQHRIYSYIDRGFYSHQIRRLWHFFGKQALLILKQEDLKEYPNECLNKIFKLLNINEIEPLDNLETHLGNYKESIDISTHEYLKNVFWHEICQIESLLGWDCQNWLSEYQ
tara:strand:- start:68 stop:817 length:750 start_codon:yes stop_codon:yes gene_type:complete